MRRGALSGNPRIAIRRPQRCARRVTHASHRAPSLALAAENLPLESAKAVYREALEESFKNRDWDNSKTSARIAALAWNRDRALGQELFNAAKTKLTATESSGDWQRGNAFWFFYARVAPGESRLQLEKSWSASRRQNAEWGRESIVRAMTAVDLQRALEMAAEISNAQEKFSAQQHIAQYLLLTNDERMKVSFDRWDVAALIRESHPTDW